MPRIGGQSRSIVQARRRADVVAKASQLGETWAHEAKNEAKVGLDLSFLVCRLHSAGEPGGISKLI